MERGKGGGGGRFVEFEWGGARLERASCWSWGLDRSRYAGMECGKGVGGGI